MGSGGRGGGVKSIDYCDPMFFKELRFQIVYPTRESANLGQRFQLEKLRFRDGLVWTVGLNVETKLRFQISLA